MTVKVTKPALNLREELSSLKKPSGVAGEAMLRAETPQEQFNLIGAGRKNLIINGGFDVWQRGTTGWTAGYTADRWRIISGVANVYKSDGGLVLYRDVSGEAVIANNLESLDCAHLVGKDVTVSFEATPVTGTPTSIEVALQHATSVDSHSSSTTLISRVTPTLIDGRYVHTFKNLPANAANGLQVRIFQSSTSALEVKYDNVQLELGSVATPFEHRSYGEELALCQRYYQKMYNDAASSAHHTTSFGAYTSIRGFCGISLPCEMRARPSVTYNSNVYITSPTLSTKAISSISSYARAGNIIILDINTSTTMTAGSFYQLLIGSTGYIDFDAEL